MRAHGFALAVAFAACTSACSGSASRVETAWIGHRNEPRILAVSTQGGQPADAAVAPAIDGPVRALLRRRNGSMVALQDVSGGAPPAVLLSSSGERLATFSPTDGSGAALFDAESPPWSAAEASDGTIWVTGGPAPVRYAADGTFVGRADPAPVQPTYGIAALPDGRMAVAYGAGLVALYDSGGSVAEWLSPTFGYSYSKIDALAARTDGTLLVSVMRNGLNIEGVVVAARLEAGSLVAVSDPEVAARFPEGPPSALVSSGGDVLVGPSLVESAPAACVERLSADLATRNGCLVPGAQRGVAVAP